MSKKPVRIVENGKSNAVIVVAKDLGHQATKAVDDLVRVVALMSGSAIPVVEDGAVQNPGAQIHIGQTAFVREADLLPASLPVNGYRIAVLESGGISRLVIIGRASLGISHGVYSLLTQELGVMWGMPAAMFEDIPKRQTVEIGHVDRTEFPSFGFRVFSGNDPDWIRRNRIDDGGRNLPYYGHGHNLFTIFPPEKYAKDHPEYYALLDGKRQWPERQNGEGPQPCLTNPDVIRITIETVRAFYDANPEISTFSLCPNDSAKFCECPSCLALDEGMERYRGRRMNSDSYFYFIETVAKELMKTHPDRYVGTYAYWTTELPPRRIKKLPPNVVVYLTQDSSQYFDPAYEARDRELLESWSNVAHHLAVYDYYGLGWFTPRVYPTIVKRILPFLPKVNVKGFYNETYPYWAHVAPHLFLVTRLLWDVHEDPDAVLTGWYERMFRECASQVRSYFETLEAGWMKAREGKWFQGLDWLAEQLHQWDPAIRDEAWRKINEAYEAAKNETTRQRIAYIRQGNRLAYLLSKTLEETLSLGPKDKQLEPRLRAIFGRVAEANTLFHNFIEADPTYGHAYYRGARATIQMQWWMGFLASLIGEVLSENQRLKKKLTDEEPTYREMIAAEAYPDVPRRIREARVMFGRPFPGS